MHMEIDAEIDRLISVLTKDPNNVHARDRLTELFTSLQSKVEALKALEELTEHKRRMLLLLRENICLRDEVRRLQGDSANVVPLVPCLTAVPMSCGNGSSIAYLSLPHLTIT